MRLGTLPVPRLFPELLGSAPLGRTAVRPRDADWGDEGDFVGEEGGGRQPGVVGDLGTFELGVGGDFRVGSSETWLLVGRELLFGIVRGLVAAEVGEFDGCLGIVVLESLTLGGEGGWSSIGGRSSIGRQLEALDLFLIAVGVALASELT